MHPHVKHILCTHDAAFQGCITCDVRLMSVNLREIVIPPFWPRVWPDQRLNIKIHYTRANTYIFMYTHAREYRAYWPVVDCQRVFARGGINWTCLLVESHENWKASKRWRNSCENGRWSQTKTHRQYKRLRTNLRTYTRAVLPMLGWVRVLFFRPSKRCYSNNQTELTHGKAARGREDHPLSPEKQPADKRMCLNAID